MVFSANLQGKRVLISRNGRKFLFQKALGEKMIIEWKRGLAIHPNLYQEKVYGEFQRNESGATPPGGVGVGGKSSWHPLKYGARGGSSNNRCPDEEGIETPSQDRTLLPTGVTTDAPTKRGWNCHVGQFPSENNGYL